MQEEAKTIIVLGVARSGTSMTAGIIEHLGIHVSKTEAADNRMLKFNAKGSFESKHMRIMHDIQRELGNDFFEKKVIKAREKYRQQIETAMQKGSSGNAIWGYKALGIEAVDVMLPMIKNPHIILVTRSSTEHAKSYYSLQVETLKDKTAKHPHITNSLVDAASGILRCCRVVARNKQYPHYLTSYESIRENPVQQAKNIAQFIGIKITEQMIVKIQDFIDPRLRSWRNDGLNKSTYKNPGS